MASSTSSIGAEEGGAGEAQHDTYGFTVTGALVFGADASEESRCAPLRDAERACERAGAGDARGVKKLREMCFSGFPPAVRVRVWEALAGSDRLRTEQPTLYSDIASKETENSGNECFECIERDLPRHFATHRDAAQQVEHARPVLRALVCAYPCIGYTSALGVVVARLTPVFDDPERLFFFVHALLDRPSFVAMFGAAMAGVRGCFAVWEWLLERFVPSVHAHFNQLGMSAPMYMCTYFSTFSLYGWPTAAALRVMDVALCHGPAATQLMMLALVRRLKTQLCGASFEACLQFFQSLSSEVIGVRAPVPFQEIARSAEKMWGDCAKECAAKYAAAVDAAGDAHREAQERNVERRNGLHSG